MKSMLFKEKRRMQQSATVLVDQRVKIVDNVNS